jgi:hypothetical protein
MNAGFPLHRCTSMVTAATQLAKNCEAADNNIFLAGWSSLVKNNGVLITSPFMFQDLFYVSVPVF